MASADYQLGRFINELEKRGLKERTLVVVTSDHGEGLEDHAEPTHTYFVYESTMRVPLVFWGPTQLVAGRRIVEPVGTVDIMPTILDLMSIPAMADGDGRSVRDSIVRESAAPPLSVYGEASAFASTFGLPILRFVRDGRWKYIHKINPELYDVIADPGELRNRIAEKPAIAKRLRARLAEVVAQDRLAESDAQLRIDPERAAELEALGYVAQSPVAAMSTEDDPMALYGADPNTLTDATRRVAVGLTHADRGDLQKAIDLLTPILAKFPNSSYLLRKMATFNRKAGHAADADVNLAALLEIEPCNEIAREVLKRSLDRRSLGREMVEMLAKGVEDCPEAAATINNLAWVLAAHPSEGVRDGKRSVKIMRELLEEQGAQNPLLLDTLAAGLAESGEYAEAAKMQKRVLSALAEIPLPDELRAQLESHLHAYEAGRPIRDATLGAGS